MMNFYTDVIQRSWQFRSRARVSDVDLLEPQTRAAVNAIIQDAYSLGFDLAPFETYRSGERQSMLFKNGATKLRNVGVHHYGLACDLVVYIDREPTWKVDYSFLGPLAAKHGLVWGGDWGAPGEKHTFVDSDHVQRCTLTQQNDLFAGVWYPETEVTGEINV